MVHDDDAGHDWDPGVSRRGMLGLFGSVMTLAGLSACGGGGGSAMPSASTTAATASASATATAAASAAATATAAAATTTATAACAETLEGEVGPYYTDDSASGYDRSTILSNLDGTSTQTGVPLTLTVYVYDTEKSCAPYAGAQIDIWHCNAAGIYSNESSENTTGLSWLRGYQITDSTGKATFSTIVPGWYSGRTTHIHLRVRSTYDSGSASTDGTNTTQVFFSQSLIDTLATSVTPYSAEGTNPTTNASDRVYTTQTNGENLLSLVGSITAGYTAAFSIGLPIQT